MACYVNPVPTFSITQHLSPTEFRPAKATRHTIRRQDCSDGTGDRSRFSFVCQCFTYLYPKADLC